MPQATIIKKLLAALYDSFLILATIFIATALTMPFTQGNVATNNRIFMSIYLLSVMYLFCAWFWTHGGQTLGMRAWRQQLVSKDGYAVTWKQSLIRFITAVPAWLLFFVGIILLFKTEIAASFTNIPAWLISVVGFAWVLLNMKSDNWRDKLSGTQVVNIEGLKKN